MVVQVPDGAIGLPPDSEVTWNDELETSREFVWPISATSPLRS